MRGLRAKEDFNGREDLQGGPSAHQLLVQAQQDCEDIYLDAEEPEA